MLDESMFEDIHEIAENSAYLKAVEERDVSLEMLEQLPPYEQCAELERRMEADGLLTFDAIFHSATGYYMFSCFLISDYAVDKAVFLKDVEAYRAMRFESARQRIAALLYARFVSLDEDAERADQAVRPGEAAAHSGDPSTGGTAGVPRTTAADAAPLASASAKAALSAVGGAASQRAGASVFARMHHRLPYQSASVLPAPSIAALPPLPIKPGAGRSSASLLRSHLGAVHPAPAPPAAATLSSSRPPQSALQVPSAPPSSPPSPGAALELSSASALSAASGAGPAAFTASSRGGALPSTSPLSAPPSAATTAPSPPSHPSASRAIAGEVDDGETVRGTDAADAIASHPQTSAPPIADSSAAALRPHIPSPTVTALGSASSSSSSVSTSASVGVALSLSPGPSPGGSFLSISSRNNAIGVYGKSVARVRVRVLAGEASKDLFDEVAREVSWDLRLDAFPRFRQSAFFQRFIRTAYIETVRVGVKDFTTFRVLGRGGFGAVHACRKKNSGTIYAMKAINKRLVKVKSALDNVLEERNVLTCTTSNFVTNLKYAAQDEDTLYLIMDLMLGGDLKFHLINAGRFTEKRARFYAAQVLLGLEHVHRMSIIYRDMKLENVLLDEKGHCKISDLGLAVVTKVKIKGYAGTPGYTAPEMIKNKLYGPAADIFSYGVMLYRMLCGSKPFKGKVDRELDKAVLEKKPLFPKEVFSKEAGALLSGLLQKRPEQRLGCGERGVEDIKEHPFFESVDWGLLESGLLDPPFVPNKFDVNAASLKDIGDFDRAKYKAVKLDDRFRARVRTFDWVNVAALQEEMVAVLEKADAHTNFEKFAHAQDRPASSTRRSQDACCTVL